VSSLSSENPFYFCKYALIYLSGRGGHSISSIQGRPGAQKINLSQAFAAKPSPMSPE